MVYGPRKTLARTFRRNTAGRRDPIRVKVNVHFFAVNIPNPPGGADDVSAAPESADYFHTVRWSIDLPASASLE